MHQEMSAEREREKETQKEVWGSFKNARLDSNTPASLWGIFYDVSSNQLIRGNITPLLAEALPRKNLGDICQE